MLADLQVTHEEYRYILPRLARIQFREVRNSLFVWLYALNAESRIALEAIGYTLEP